MSAEPAEGRRDRAESSLGHEPRTLFSGPLWKLSHDGDPRNPEAWVRREMWLTSSGGLFYNDEGHGGAAVGVGISSLHAAAARDLEGAEGRFALEVHAASLTLGAEGASLVLAADSAQERDAWLRQLQSFQATTRVEKNTLNPLDLFIGAHSGRGRSRSTFLTEEQVATLALHEEAAVTEDDDEGEVAPRLRSQSSSSVASTSPPTPSASAGAGACGAGGAGTATVQGTQGPQGPQGEEQAEGPASATAGSSTIRRNSQWAFAQKTHTTLVLDWDDTIFPTTWVRNDCSMNWRLSLEQQCEPGPRLKLIQGLLAKHLQRCDDFFNEAVKHANIFIVTLARRPWVEMSIQNFLPGFDRIMQAHNLKLIYAQEYVEECVAQDYNVQEFMSSEEATHFWTRVKGVAISRELEEFHAKHDVSWKNVISIGDSDFERYGTIIASEDYMRREMEGGAVHLTGVTAEGVSKDGHLKRLRTKTVKLLNEPTVEELTAELAILKTWLPHIVKRDEGFDVEFACSDDDENLRQLHRQITGEDALLSWCHLAGMDT